MTYGETYYWVWCTKGGTPVILSPAYTDEEEANRVGFTRLQGNFEVLPLTSRDRREATRRIKRIILDRTNNLEEALKRARHQEVS